MSTTNVLNEARQLIERRLADLDEERKRLERALAELGGKVSQRGPGRPRGGGKAKAASGARTPKRRKRRGGTRADQALAMIEKEPGIGPADIAKAMKVKPNYIYKVLGELEKKGRVKKQARQYFPAGSAPKK